MNAIDQRTDRVELDISLRLKQRVGLRLSKQEGAHGDATE